MTFLEFIELIVSFFRKSYPTGLIDDPRDAAQKLFDYIHEERVPEEPPKPEDPFGFGWSPDNVPNENQYGTNSCVPESVLLAAALERKAQTGEYARLAPLMPYRLRSNFPLAGSWPQEMFQRVKTYGAPLRATLPTPPGANDNYANALVLTNQMYIEAELYRGGEYYTFEEPRDFEEIARASLKHEVSITIFATNEEWSRSHPIIINRNLTRESAPIRHQVTVLRRKGFWENGVRYLYIKDSAPFGGLFRRYLSEEFIRARCYGAGYWEGVRELKRSKPPKYNFTKVLKVGDEGEEVRAMQRLLIAEGLLPADMASGYFAGRTLAGVRAFQNRYSDDILVPLGLDAPTVTWGAGCIRKANALSL